jgi:hypothetical protein
MSPMLVSGLTSLEMAAMRAKLSAQLFPVSREKDIPTVLLSSLWF